MKNVAKANTQNRGLESKILEQIFAKYRVYVKGNFVHGARLPGPSHPQAKLQSLASRDKGSEQPTICLTASILDSSMGFTSSLSSLLLLLLGMVEFFLSKFINPTSVAVQANRTTPSTWLVFALQIPQFHKTSWDPWAMAKPPRCRVLNATILMGWVSILRAFWIPGSVASTSVPIKGAPTFCLIGAVWGAHMFFYHIPHPQSLPLLPFGSLTTLLELLTFFGHFYIRCSLSTIAKHWK